MGKLKPLTTEHKKLKEHRERKANWKLWGPYLSERAWATVREDYSSDGSAWNYFPHDHAPYRTYRWNEDGLGGISDRNQYLCFGLALWNQQDPILKERFFGLSGDESNHGEDVKEIYFYLDSTPTHSYMKMLYKYPQKEFPYKKLREESAKRGFEEPEYELIDTGIFDKNRYFDVEIEYAKADQEDILIQITVSNRGEARAQLDLLPTLWFRNTWSWGYPDGPMGDVPGKPHLKQPHNHEAYIEVQHPQLEDYHFFADENPSLLFTENETNHQQLSGGTNPFPYVKDAFHRYIIHEELEAINPAHEGTKAAAHYKLSLEPGASKTVRMRLGKCKSKPFQNFSSLLKEKKKEADAFYQAIQNSKLDADELVIQRQALAGMLWTKQMYYYDIEQWLHGDLNGAPPPESRLEGRNHEWENLVNFDIISMPDAWEYPWYASWDLAFHCIPLSLVDTDYAKRQLALMTREWYMHTNGQLPAYEWKFSDVNPPVHAWSAWRVYKIDKYAWNRADRAFLEGIFHKLLLNFTWWVNRKDAAGNNIFQGGFLGLDNISLFDRSAVLPTGGRIDQSDGTAWMGFYTVLMMRIALELAKENPIYQDSATKFFEHFLRIAHAMTTSQGRAFSLWDEEDGFFYDALHLPDGTSHHLKVRSLVGLLPLFAVEIIDPEVFETMPTFKHRVDWFISQRPNISCNMTGIFEPGQEGRRMVSFLTRKRLERVLHYMLDENEFLSEFGIRSLSKYHEKNPYSLEIGGQNFSINYEPAESQTGMFGGNSNWRGPIWFPINFLIIESLQKYHHYYGESFTVEFPTGSGRRMHLGDVATELSHRLIRLFSRDRDENRPIYGNCNIFQNDPHWKDHLLFHEYFHGDTGKGLGANHQTGWTGLIAKLLQQSGGTN